jgi:hypothetical protein
MIFFYIQFIVFYSLLEKQKYWEDLLISKYFKKKNILEILVGFGFDGIDFTKQT